VGAVNLNTGELTYVDAREGRFLDAVLASSAEPILMPIRRIAGEPFYDGGLRDITPLKHAIEQGATRIVMVLCQPEHDSPWAVNPGSVMQLAEDVMGIVTNEILANDIAVFQGVNDLVLKVGETVAGKRYIPLTVIRPAQALRGDVTTFTPADITAMLDRGRQDAAQALAPWVKAAAA
jgi:NTE family protein